MVVHGASTSERSPRKIRSGVCRAHCSSQSPTQRALGCNGAADFSQMLPSARRSATMSGTANSVSEFSRRWVAADVIGFLRRPLYALLGSGLAFALRENRAPPQCASRCRTFHARARIALLIKWANSIDLPRLCTAVDAVKFIQALDNTCRFS